MAKDVYDFLDPTEKRKRYGTLRARLWADRSSFDSHWRELADFLMPRRTRFWASDRNKGDRRNQNIIDSTGRFAARTLASGLHAGLTSPARPWMKLTTPDPSLAEFGPVKAWLHEVTIRMMTLFGTSNLLQRAAAGVSRHRDFRHGRHVDRAGLERPVPLLQLSDRQLRHRPGRARPGDDVLSRV
jgi:hypothetical protein